MATEIQHAWQYYLDPVLLDKFWETEKHVITGELKTTYMMETPPEWYVRAYFENQITAEWHRQFCLYFLYSKTDRPQDPDMDARTLLECCRIHLEGCYLCDI